MKLAMCFLVLSAEGRVSWGATFVLGLKKNQLVIRAPFSTIWFSAHLQCPTEQVSACRMIEKHWLLCHQGSLTGICVPAATMHAWHGKNVCDIPRNTAAGDDYSCTELSRGILGVFVNLMSAKEGSVVRAAEERGCSAVPSPLKGVPSMILYNEQKVGHAGWGGLDFSHPGLPAFCLPWAQTPQSATNTKSSKCQHVRWSHSLK